MTFLCFSKTKTKKCNTKYKAYGYQLDIFVNIVIILFLDNGEMFVKGECRCSFWLVKSSYLNQTFNYFRIV